MLSADAARLAAIEVLCPTAAIAAGSGFPTLAGAMVYDSRAVPLQDLDPQKAYTPVLGVYSGNARTERRGDLSDAVDYASSAEIEVVAELAVIAQDEQGQDFADAMAASDPEARIVLGALCSQVRYLLTQGQSGYLFRKLVMGVSRIDEEPFAVPGLGLRWQRMTLRFHCDLRDDAFDPSAGGLPSPVSDLYAGLPDGSYAKAKLAAMIAAFPVDARPAFAGANILGTGGGDLIGST